MHALPPGFPQRYSHRFSHDFPQRPAGLPGAVSRALRRRLAALAGTVAACLLSACAMQPPAPPAPPPTARPQAVPLPQAQVQAPPAMPGATPRQRIVQIALQEWQRWGGQTIRIGRDDTACVVSSPLPLPPPALPDGIEARIQNGATNGASASSADTDESFGTTAAPGCAGFPDGTGMEATPQGCALAQRYWAIVGKEVDCQQITEGRWAWSAVFISWVLRQAGLNERQFLTGQSHSMYVVDARDGILPAPAFRLEPLPAMPRPGDILCAGRGRDKYLSSVDEVGFGTTPMHCDIVVEVDATARVVKTIGGNLQQSVSMELVELGDSGLVDGFTNSHAPWLVLMRNQLP
ncbi:DUF2272 domain-containing protein [Cupriavidus gilardii]|uniref:DUF2272 domain-containing protein n=2 Tax=Cupriavidus gilardii TaxID=82541 RepID=A0A849BL25_9BURK|nr:DUF2272 domain-containing protein [Cupriavidus gilardii]KAB0593994.1 DUF2272 domain-containing protein [Cupriavidus gilardii]MCT9013945.1 DUF2272 domain-containing protein [Cupriavidus gilardii]MCT9052133.1 DUF2272 domain-containing protein [Cupriavidus gilardii]MCT9117081.1 DUF2272 domain-containing protein [Cupriavidus gilardii]NNH13217.1 DUF2272 domain-containing protein [Cupriavidus gilardii]